MENNHGCRLQTDALGTAEAMARDAVSRAADFTCSHASKDHSSAHLATDADFRSLTKHRHFQQEETWQDNNQSWTNLQTFGN